MKTLLIAVTCALAVALTGCETESKVASDNIRKEAESFKIQRRIVFYNGITNDYMATIEGACSIEVQKSENQLEVTCRTGRDRYVKHFLGLSDNVTYFAEQIGDAAVSGYHHKIIWRPTTILPTITVDLPN